MDRLIQSSGKTRITVAAVAVLLALLAGAIFVSYYGWTSAGDVTMPAWGWWMMGLGIFFSLLVGCGLMALVFYSSRAGFDEPPDLSQKRKPRSDGKIQRLMGSDVMRKASGRRFPRLSNQADCKP